MRCDWCGKFRKDIDLHMYGLPNYDQTEEEYFIVCRWCSPEDFTKEDSE